MKNISIRTTLFMLILLSAFGIQNHFTVQRILAQEPRNSETMGLRLPEFDSDKPEFCRVSFPGSESAKTIFLILDGPTLYVDRNANGDMTEKNERVHATRSSRMSERDLRFQIGQIEVGTFVHESINLTVTPLENYDRNNSKASELLKTNPQAKAYSMSAEIQHEHLKGSCDGSRVLTLVKIMDADGILQFGASPELAPTINFAGPFEIRLNDETRLRPGSEMEVVLAVGSKGKGPGTFAAISYENLIPDDAWPKLTLTTESKDGGPPIETTFEMQHRC